MCHVCVWEWPHLAWFNKVVSEWIAVPFKLQSTYCHKGQRVSLQRTLAPVGLVVLHRERDGVCGDVEENGRAAPVTKERMAGVTNL